MLKATGILLVAIGVIVAAAAGIQLGPAEYSVALQEARTALTGSTPQLLPPTPAATRIDDWYGAAGSWFLGGLALLLAGAIIARVAIGRGGAAEAAADGHDFEDSLARLAVAISGTRSLLDQGSADSTRLELERLSRELVLPMIESRFALQRRFGLAGCVAVLGPLSGAERLLNRAWSALVDGHAAETRASLDGAAAEVEATQRALGELDRARTLA